MYSGRVSGFKIVSGVGAIILSMLSLQECSNRMKAEYQKRIENMNYVKEHAPDRYYKILEEIVSDKDNQNPIYNNLIWQRVAEQVRDSIQDDSIAKVSMAETNYAKSLINVQDSANVGK